MKKIFAFQIALFLTLFFLTAPTYPQEVKGLWDEEAVQEYYNQNYREWELADGTKIWAQYVTVGKNTIILKDENFHPIILKTWELSKEDAKFQREQWKKNHGKVKAHWDEESAQEFLDGLSREWVLADGTKLWAYYKSVEENAIVLIDEDGKSIRLKTKELSKEDAAFQRKKWNQHLRDVRKEKAKERKLR